MRVPKERMERILELTLESYGKLDFADGSIGRRIPDAKIRELMDSVCTVSKAGAAVTVLRSPRKDSKPTAKVLLGWYRWHTGASGGSLWGPMGRFGQWSVTAEQSDSLNTLALVLLGGRSKATGLWKQALGC